MRSPLVGLTEAELLDIADGLPVDPTRPHDLPNLTLWTDLDHVGHDLARRVLEILQSLAKRARTTTPHAALGRAWGPLSDPRSRRDLRSSCQAPIAGHGHPRQTDFGGITVAELFC